MSTIILRPTRAGFIYECVECREQFIDDKSIEAGHDCEVTA